MNQDQQQKPLAEELHYRVATAEDASLLRHSESRCRRRDHAGSTMTMRLNPLSSRDGLRDWYHRCGYKEMGVREAFVGGGGGGGNGSGDDDGGGLEGLYFVVMEKKLEAAADDDDGGDANSAAA
ncbi:hypothetical protein ISF_03566 [Cordyceps fumosorosea ARSEF 2679]|uniref:N-acetyltransferase domain-containing protein n=1 Tax=Cordyceps fumosorosea (strain ARSEF 2679) TaxID=1081104 RepID=A0A167ZDY1_CORFA|nr:hypothetical protein ISF_03566 [Cordyceps fumosorosea ARSEF 2679]OAA67390.1 hypothetical protein ISF_03566 [Cordyceps fumosorosea ARSEF 2679]